MPASPKYITAIAATAALAMAATAVAAVGGPTQVTVEPAAALTAGDRSPFDVPGVKTIRRGKAIPSGYVLLGQKVTIKRGKLAAGASLFFKCPADKRLKGFATTGAAGFGARQPYLNHRQAYIESFRNIDAIGVVYAVCR
jgi:hypothetical protein